MSKEKIPSRFLVHWMRGLKAQQAGHFVFLTLSFDRYRRFAYTIPSSPQCVPTREDVWAGLAQPMPAVNGRAALVNDLDRFCCYMMRALLGRRYPQRFAQQPVAIGALDEPHYKGVSKRSALARKPGDTFDHAHFAMFLPDVELRGRSLIHHFVELAESGRLETLWKKLNPTGEFHFTDVFDLAGAVDYAFKSAKLSVTANDEWLLWPAAVPNRRSLQAPGSANHAVAEEGSDTPADW